MGCLGWILVGLVAGGLAKFLLPGKDPGGIVTTIIVGIAGASLGGWIATRLGYGSFEGFDLRSMALAVGGAILLLVLVRLIAGSKDGKRKV
jgi:uncharacterized membrane protein YeaQ/YmgE (transglycosylase-associated protein family)